MPLKSLCRVALVAVAGVVVQSAHAQALKPAAPGLWATDSKVLMNGVNVLEKLQGLQMQALQNLPPEDRARMQAAMGNGGHGQRQCLTPQQAAQLKDPKAWLAEMQRQQPSCKFEATSVVGDTANFKGRCSDPQGFTGDVQGTIKQPDSKQFQAQFAGKGAFNVQKPGGGMASGPADMQSEMSGHWVSADCGKLAGGDE